MVVFHTISSSAYAYLGVTFIRNSRVVRSITFMAVILKAVLNICVKCKIRCFQMSFLLSKVLPCSCPPYIYFHRKWHLSYEVLCEFVSQEAFEIPVVEVMTFRFYLIKKDFLRIVKFNRLNLWWHLHLDQKWSSPSFRPVICKENDSTAKNH